MATNNSSTISAQASDPPGSPTPSRPPSSPANPPATASTPDPTTSRPPTSLPTSDPPITSSPPPTTSLPPTSEPPTPTTSKEPPPSTERPPTTFTSSSISTEPGGGRTSTVVTTITSSSPTPTDAPTSASASSSPTPTGGAISPSKGGGGGLNGSGKIAVAVVVPIAAVALLVLAAIYLWRKRKQRKEAEEQRRKEVEDYGYNPNADPAIPDVAAAGGPFEMKEDGSSGYRGWGSTTLAGSTGRKASTTMSGGAAGAAYSDATSPTRGNISDTRSGEPLMHDGSQSPEGEILGAMGPSAAGNRGDVHRGPSNASSSYSAAGRSDGSGEGGVGVAYGGGPGYYDQYGNSNPYSDGRQGPTELGAQPIIRDVTARRNTQIENSAHYPQQTAGISQNF